jgi:hypothetical protein
MTLVENILGIGGWGMIKENGSGSGGELKYDVFIYIVRTF